MDNEEMIIEIEEDDKKKVQETLETKIVLDVLTTGEISQEFLNLLKE